MTQTEIPTIDWPGKSGKQYKFWLYPRVTTFNAGQSGLYIYVKESSPNRWTPVYIGQTMDLGARLSDHEKEACINRNGATHICVHVHEGGEAARLIEEEDLIKRWTPICNIQHCQF